MQWMALMLTLAFFHGAQAKPAGGVQVYINGQLVDNGLGWVFASIPGVETSFPQPTGPNVWVRNEDILDDGPVWSTTVNLADFCGWIYIPPSGSQPDEQCALVPQELFSTPVDQTHQPICAKITVDESAQCLCDHPQSQAQVGVVVIDSENTTDAQRHAKALDEPQSMSNSNDADLEGFMNPLHGSESLQILAKKQRKGDKKALSLLFTGLTQILACIKYATRNIRADFNHQPLCTKRAAFHCMLAAGNMAAMYLLND